MSAFSHREKLPPEYGGYNGETADLYYGMGMSYSRVPVWPSCRRNGPGDSLWYNEYIALLHDTLRQ